MRRLLSCCGWVWNKAYNSSRQSSTKKLDGKAARDAAWSTAGPRLTTVFFRFNIAGALFTALELGGTWWYNRNNTDAHDDWLLSTSWSSDAEKRQNHSLDYFQQRLLGVNNESQITVTHEGHNNWLKDFFLSPSSINITLELPSLSRAALKHPLAGSPSARLSLNAYPIRTGHYNQGIPKQQSTLITEQIHHGLQLLNAEPMQLKIQRPPTQKHINGHTKEELLLELKIEQLNGEGEYRPECHAIRFTLRDEGKYKPTAQVKQAPPTTWAQVNPKLLPEITDAES